MDGYLQLKQEYRYLLDRIEYTKDVDEFMFLSKQMHAIRLELLTIESALPHSTKGGGNYDEIHVMD
ncbi:MAG: hypothetical protein K0Q79_2750 [Flavipsychrobacter sp.]|jgi:hypothetical protein|nr:hypothetical protein [Flavipsychrobacter sp.]